MALKPTTLWKHLKPNLMFFSIIGICPFHISTFRCRFYLPMFCYQIILFAIILSFTTVTWGSELLYFNSSELLIYFQSNIVIYAEYMLTTISYAAHVVNIALIFIKRRNHLKLICHLLKVDETLRSFSNQNTTGMDRSIFKLLIILLLGQLILNFGVVFYSFSSLNMSYVYMLCNAVMIVIGYTLSIYIQHLAGLMRNRLKLLENQLNLEFNRATGNRARSPKPTKRLTQIFGMFNELTDLLPLFTDVFGGQLLVNSGQQFINVSAALFFSIVNFRKHKNGLNFIDFCTLLWTGYSIVINFVLVFYTIDGTSVQVRYNLENKLFFTNIISVKFYMCFQNWHSNI